MPCLSYLWLLADGLHLHGGDDWREDLPDAERPVPAGRDEPAVVPGEAHLGDGVAVQLVLDPVGGQRDGELEGLHAAARAACEEHGAVVGQRQGGQRQRVQVDLTLQRRRRDLLDGAVRGRREAHQQTGEMCICKRSTVTLTFPSMPHVPVYSDSPI